MFVQRLCSSIVLLGLFAAAILWDGIGGKLCFTVLTVAGVLGSVYEFCRMIEKQEMPSYPVWTGLAVLFPVLGLLYKEVYPVYTVLFVVGIIIFFCVCLWIQLLCSGNRLDVLKKIMNSAAVFFLFVIPFLMLAGMYEERFLFLYLIVGTKIGAIGAYVVGSLSNKISKGRNHKLIPSISPGKSWEGLIGGLLISIGFALAVFPWASGYVYPFYFALIPGVLLFFFGSAGDLAESSLKRICGIKDSGKLIPGIGGVMDLVDSLILNTPVFAVMLFLMDLALAK
mgnify:FL=1